MLSFRKYQGSPQWKEDENDMEKNSTFICTNIKI